MASASESFLSTLLDERPAPSQAGWLERLRAQALERANELSVPTPRDEDWRFTDLVPLTRIAFQPVREPVTVDAALLDAPVLPEPHVRLVFVDGSYAPQLSDLPQSAGVCVSELRSALCGPQADRIERHLGKLAAFDRNVFTALNTAFLHHGALVLVDAEVKAPVLVHIVHRASRRALPQALYPRTLVVAGAHSRCTVIEDFAGSTQAAYFSAPVTEIGVERDASVEHVRLQRESTAAFHLASCSVAQAAGSRYRGVSIALGARLSRLEATVRHDGPACETALDGLALIDGRQLADTHSNVEHAHPEGRLRQLHKCVVAGAAHAVFNGKIVVRPGAQRIDASQSCRGLLLSDRAHIDAKPQLEIFADDVKCAHGAAIGQLDPDETFYLQSRGLSAHAARNLLTYAFAAEVIGRIPVASIVSELQRTLLARTVEAA